MDYIGATPQSNPIMGLLAERLKQAQQFATRPFGYQNPPAEMLLNLLGVPAVQQTAERLAYGEPLTTGRGMTTQIRPEVAEAALTVAPVAGLLGKATKGLPVGASIKSVDDFAEMASKGKVNMAKSQKQEIADLVAGKSKFAEANLNWDMPETYDLADDLAKKGFKSKVDDRGITRFYKNEKDLEAIESAQTPADYGKAYGYSDEDVAAFYLKRRGGDKEAAYQDFLADNPQGGLLGQSKAVESAPVLPGVSIQGGEKPLRSAVVLIGDNVFFGNTHADAIGQALKEGVIKKEAGKFIYPEGAEVDMDLFLTNEGQIIDRFQAYKMMDVGASESANEAGIMQKHAPSSMTVDEYMKQANAIRQKKEKQGLLD